MESQAQSWNDRTEPLEETFTLAEQQEYEQWLDAVYWGMRAEEAMEEGEF